MGADNMSKQYGLRENLEYNKSVNSNTAFLNNLKDKLPEFFNADRYDESGELVEPGFFDWEKFKNQFEENDIQAELTSGYQLNFIGKNYAKRQAGERPSTVIVPDTEHNTMPENKDSNNLFFTGDNLEVLRHLQSNYTNAIDFIYIDPPYNTGFDGFVYPDKFDYSDSQLQDMFGLSEEELNRYKSILGKSSHAAWLTFMYPRLYLAKKLLKDTGVFFVSIDENEYANLKLLLDEIFGEGSYLGDLIRKTRSSANDASNGFNQQHEYVFMYGKNALLSQLHGENKDSSNYKNPDNDPAGAWISDNPSARSGGPNTSFEIINPKNGHIDTPPAGRYWAFSRSTFDKWVESGKVVFKDEVKEGQRGFIIKKYLAELKTNFNTVNSLFGTDNQYMNQAATKYLRDEIFDGSDYFSSPKPVEFIKKLVKYVTNSNSIILDFFAGSATTADAVMQLNAEDGGNRQFIMATLPEPTYTTNDDGTKVPTKGGETAFNAGYTSIDEISRERIKRAAHKIKKENPLLAESQDFGFKHYRMVAPGVETLDKLEYSQDLQLDLFDDMLTPFSSQALGVGGAATGFDTILSTWLVADGYRFDSDVSSVKFGNYEAPYVENTRVYIINNGWGAENTKALVNAIGTNQLVVQTIVVYGYEIDMESLRELEQALSVLENRVNLIVRY